MDELAKALGDPAVEARAAAAWALSQMAAAAAPAVPALLRTLSDPNLRVRAMGPAAAKAIPELVKALDDASPAVRAVAADALGNLGGAAKPVVETLSRHLVDVNEPVVFVLRSVATALGNIGPAASSALPALEQALKMHRVSCAAQEAIYKIKGEPVPVWY